LLLLEKLLPLLSIGGGGGISFEESLDLFFFLPSLLLLLEKLLLLLSIGGGGGIN
jgi:hypothetical protein